jgi:hypothetical protein
MAVNRRLVDDAGKQNRKLTRAQSGYDRARRTSPRQCPERRHAVVDPIYRDAEAFLDNPDTDQSKQFVWSTLPSSGIQWGRSEATQTPAGQTLRLAE